MGLFGFILLLIGGGLLLVSGQSIALDPSTAIFLTNLINSFLSPPIGDILINGLVWATSLGGILIIIGSIIWYAAGSGFLALIGKIIVTVATFSAFYFVAMKIWEAFLLGIFSLPLDAILTYFLGLGVGFASVVLILIGDFVGAGRKKVKEVQVSKESEGA